METLTSSMCRSQWSTITPMPLSSSGRIAATSMVRGDSFTIKASEVRNEDLFWPPTSPPSSFPEFFVKRGVAVMTVRELFDFITDPSITCQNIDQYLDKVPNNASEFYFKKNHPLYL